LVERYADSSLIGMPRSGRVYLPGVPQHVIQRGNDRAALFRESFDFDCYLSCLTTATRRYGVAVHAYVLMTNHVHILVTPGSRESLAKAMHRSGTVFVQQLNNRQGRTGHRFESRYKTRFIQDEQHFIACMRYIEENPVRAVMVTSPGEYRWSSHHANAFGMDDGLVSAHPVFERLGSSRAERSAHYRALFAGTVSERDLQAVRIIPPPRGRPKKGDRPCNGDCPF
jgi:putative transposase